MKPKHPPMSIEDILSFADIPEPQTMLTRWCKGVVLASAEPVCRKLVELVTKDAKEETKERDLQVKTLHKFGESYGILGSEGNQSVTITKIYQKNTLIIQNPVIQQIIQGHCRQLAPDLFQKKLGEKGEDKNGDIEKSV